MNVDDETKGRETVGFMHLARESLCTRSELSQPHFDKYTFNPQTVGVLAHGNISTEIVYRVVEHPHDEGESQFDHMSIHSLKCSGTPADGGTLCEACLNGARTVDRSGS